MIHSTAIISKKATIGKNVTIGAFSIIHDHATIADDTTIGPFCEIGIPTDLAKKQTLSIGKKSNIRSKATIYTGSAIGGGFTAGHDVCIRENSLIGHDVQMGNRTDIQGDCEIGDHTRMHADVHIGKKSCVGKFCWLFPEVLLLNDPTPPSDTLFGVTIEDYVVVASRSMLMPGITLGTNSVVAAGSVVNIDVPEGKLAQGNPAKVICEANVIRLKTDVRIRAYPWYKRFYRGYPKEIILKWQKE